MTSKYRSKRGSAESGQAIVLVALGMIGMLAFLVLAIDGGRYYDRHRTAQNAADASSLAGLYQYQHPDGNGNKYDGILKAINTAAEKNEIPDANPPANDANNDNIEAYWINSAGDYICANGSTQLGSAEPPLLCAKITNDPSKTKPDGASGLKVRARIPYTTFMAHLIGQRDLTAQADGTALIFQGASYNPNPNNTNAIWTGGGSMCSTYQYPALYWGDASGNNTDWGMGVFVNGYLRIENMPNTIDANGSNAAKAGVQGKIISVYTPQTKYDNGPVHWPNTGGSPEVPKPSGPTADPYTTPYNFYGQGSGSPLVVPPTYPFPNDVYMHHSQFAPGVPPNSLPKSKMLVQAKHFRPDQAAYANGDSVDTPKDLGISSTAADVPNGVYTDNYIFKGHELNIDTNPAHTDPNQYVVRNFYHYINEGTGPGAAAKNGDDFRQMVEAQGKRGIFFVDGDVETTELWPGGVTLIATGTMHITVNGNTKVGNAGPYAWGFSFLASGNKSGQPNNPPSNPATACAGDGQTVNWVVHFEGEQNGWSGIAYVPNGLFWIDTNYHSSYDPVGPIIAWSQATAVKDPSSGISNHPGNNFQFSMCDARCFPQPTYQLGLQQ